MRFTEKQKTILQTTSAKTKLTSAELADACGSRPGPVARSAYSLVENGLLRKGEDKEGNVYFTRTAEGGKVARSFA